MYSIVCLTVVRAFNVWRTDRSKVMSTSGSLPDSGAIEFPRAAPPSFPNSFPGSQSFGRAVFRAHCGAHQEMILCHARCDKWQAARPPEWQWTLLPAQRQDTLEPLVGWNSG